MLLLRQMPQVAYGVEARWLVGQLMGYLDQDSRTKLRLTPRTKLGGWVT
jgi:hypothetical protein